MSNRVVLFNKKSNVEGSEMTESSVITRLVEVTPCFHGHGQRDFVSYSSIRDHLNAKTLREIAKAFPVDVKETSTHFIWTYSGKPSIYIDRKTWRLYSIHNREHNQYQAWYLIRQLAKYGYVVDFKRVQQRRKFMSPYKGMPSSSLFR